MATRTLGKNKKIQNDEKYQDDVTCVLGSSGLWHTCRPRGGRNVITRTMQLFDMVAELAIELARI
eukprot:3983487-Amphidinium_carterae.1